MTLTLQKQTTNAWGFTLCFMLAAVVMLLPDLAAASSSVTSDANQIQKVLCNMILLLQGNIARGIAAGGVIFLGFSLFLGKISWGTAMALGIGLGCIFGAQEIVNMASGGGKLACVSATLGA